MGKQDKRVDVQALATRGSALTAAAAALDMELARFEEHSAAAAKIPLNSEKNLERAARAFNEAADIQERVAGHARALAEAVAQTRDRELKSAELIHARAQVLQARTTEFQAMLERFAQLGMDAKTINEMVQVVAAQKKAATTKEQSQQVIEMLCVVDGKMADIVERAQAVARDASAQDMDDVFRQADGLRQQIHSARNKLKLLRTKLTDA